MWNDTDNLFVNINYSAFCCEVLSTCMQSLLNVNLLEELPRWGRLESQAPFPLEPLLNISDYMRGSRVNLIPSFLLRNFSFLVLVERIFLYLCITSCALVYEGALRRSKLFPVPLFFLQGHFLHVKQQKEHRLEPYSCSIENQKINICSYLTKMFYWCV